MINENGCPESLHFFQARCPNLSESNQLISVYDNNTSERTERLIIHHGPRFQSPYFWRKLAIPYIDTGLTLFIFNDVFPVTTQSTGDSKFDWLQNLITAANKYPDYDVFQPWIWESKKCAHNFWKSLEFLRFEGRLYVNHKYDSNIRHCKTPENLDYFYQNMFLEDHCFMVRTDFIRNHWNMDENAAFTKEIRDMCLDIYYQKGKILGCYTSQVVYLKDDIELTNLKEILTLSEEDSRASFTLCDLNYYSWRRSTSVCYKTFRYIEEKWGYIDKWDRINEIISFPRLNYYFNQWPKIMATAPESDHHKVILSLLLCTGFDQFKFVLSDSKLPYHDFVEFYEDYLEFINKDNESNEILINAKRSTLKDYHPGLGINIDKSRLQFVREGAIFTVQDDINGQQVHRRFKDSLSPDTDLVIIQSCIYNKILTGLIHRYLSKKIDAEICVTLVLSNTTLFFIRTSETKFREALSNPAGKILSSSFSGIQFFNKENDVMEFEICLGKIKDCLSHIATGKPSQPAIIRLLRKIKLMFSIKMLSSAKRYT